MKIPSWLTHASILWGLALVAVCGILFLPARASYIAPGFPGTAWVATSTQTTNANAVLANVEQSALSSTGQGSRTVQPVAGSVYRIIPSGTYQTPLSPGSVTVRVKFGSATLATEVVTASILATSSTNRGLLGYVIVTCRSVDGSGVGTFVVDGSMGFETTAGFTTLPVNSLGSTVTASVLTPQAFDVTESWSSTLSQGTTITTTTIEQLR